MSDRQGGETEIEAVARALEGAMTMFPNPSHAARYYAWKVLAALDEFRSSGSAAQRCICQPKPYDDDPRCPIHGSAAQNQEEESCPWCDGQGVVTGQGHVAECGRCDGTGERRSPQGEDHEAGIEAATLALAGEPRCCCDDDWRVPSFDGCPVHGKGEWPVEADRRRAQRIVDAYCSRSSSEADVERAVTDRTRETIEALVPWIHWQGGLRGTHNCEFARCQIEPCPMLRSLLAPAGFLDPQEG